MLCKLVLESQGMQSDDARTIKRQIPRGDSSNGLNIVYKQNGIICITHVYMCSSEREPFTKH